MTYGWAALEVRVARLNNVYGPLERGPVAARRRRRDLPCQGVCIEHIVDRGPTV